MGALRLFAWPDQPGENLLLWHMAQDEGWTFVHDPSAADFRMLHRDTTWIEPGAANPWEGESAGWINGRCRDISKRRVAEVFADVFGYPVAVDPLAWSGPMVVKSDRNFTKDGRILIGSASTPQPGMVYQRFIDSRDRAGRVVDHRVIVVGDQLPVTLAIFTPLVTNRISIPVPSEAIESDAGILFSAAEREQLKEFCRRFGLDFGGLDVIRDPEDGRIYILDVTNTQGTGDMTYGIGNPRYRRLVTAAFHHAFGTSPLPSSPEAVR